ncbi:DUF2306 domain-containing protein [Kutzneria sp. 744]|uniref:DUF2306 domain-containing protein n=1 Tax=Kutzneria sp. (strain 744) TaxID=345341 RepID=UPI0004B02A1B|nr:DUF2306 domain-containing protein [Kutzneria sp. 744]
MATIVQSEPTTGRVERRKRRRWPLVTLAVVTVATLVYMLSAYVPPVMSNSRIPVQGTGHFVLLVAHIFTATVATLTGLVQFWPTLRARYPKAHRWTGRAYFFLGVFPSSVLAIPVMVLAPYGAANQAAVAVLDVLWIITAVAGYRAARARRFADHRRWMIRNYALTLSSLASRFFTPIMALIIIPQATGPVYQSSEVVIGHDIASGSAWLSLVVTMVIAEGYLQRRQVAKSRP